MRQTSREARAHASGLRDVSAERVFMELRRIIATQSARCGIELMGELGATVEVLPELEALRGVEQSRFHHLDVYGHTLEALDRTIELTTGVGPGYRVDVASVLIGAMFPRCWPSRWPMR